MSEMPNPLPNCWAALQAELAPEIPPEAVTIRQFADAAGIDTQRVTREFADRVKRDEFRRAKRGRSYWYWPTKENT